jgi:small subunit ribosomal protein S18
VARKSPPRPEQGQSSSRGGSSGSGPRRGGPGGRRGERIRPRKYTKINSETIDYKDLNLLRRFLSDRGKVRSRRVTGLSRQHQRELALAVKRARELGMLPYVGER